MFSEPMENWIEHPSGPFNLTGRKLTDAPDNRVSIGVPFAKDGEDDYGGGTADEFFIELHAANTIHSSIMYCKPYFVMPNATAMEAHALIHVHPGLPWLF
jgi:hypothetical protein